MRAHGCTTDITVVIGVFIGTLAHGLAAFITLVVAVVVSTDFPFNGSATVVTGVVCIVAVAVGILTGAVGSTCAVGITDVILVGIAAGCDNCITALVVTDVITVVVRIFMIQFTNYGGLGAQHCIALGAADNGIVAAICGTGCSHHIFLCSRSRSVQVHTVGTVAVVSRTITLSTPGLINRICKGTTGDGDGALFCQIRRVAAVAIEDLAVDGAAGDDGLAAVVDTLQSTVLHGQHAAVPDISFKVTALDGSSTVNIAAVVHIVQGCIIGLALRLEGTVFNGDLAIVCKDDVLHAKHSTIAGHSQVTTCANVDRAKVVSEVRGDGLAAQIQDDLLFDSQPLGQFCICQQGNGLAVFSGFDCISQRTVIGIPDFRDTLKHGFCHDCSADLVITDRAIDNGSIVACGIVGGRNLVLLDRFSFCVRCCIGGCSTVLTLVPVSASVEAPCISVIVLQHRNLYIGAVVTALILALLIRIPTDLRTGCGLCRDVHKVVGFGVNIALNGFRFRNRAADGALGLIDGIGHAVGFRHDIAANGIITIRSFLVAVSTDVCTLCGFVGAHVFAADVALVVLAFVHTNGNGGTAFVAVVIVVVVDTDIALDCAIAVVAEVIVVVAVGVGALIDFTSVVTDVVLGIFVLVGQGGNDIGVFLGKHCGACFVLEVRLTVSTVPVGVVAGVFAGCGLRLGGGHALMGAEACAADVAEGIAIVVCAFGDSITTDIALVIVTIRACGREAADITSVVRINTSVDFANPSTTIIIIGSAFCCIGSQISPIPMLQLACANTDA